MVRSVYVNYEAVVEIVTLWVRSVYVNYEAVVEIVTL